LKQQTADGRRQEHAFRFAPVSHSRSVMDGRRSIGYFPIVQVFVCLAAYWRCQVYARAITIMPNTIR
jgi:hypothetical protein